mgnify:FL=1|tara:strand:- start:655 stop:993 length:339 start_codon:yes stop_codon:yes gene_type:complete
MYKIRFARITEQGHASLHAEFPLVQSHDIIIRYETSSDGKPMNAQVVPNGKRSLEPLFTLRASDPMAASYVKHWAEMAELNNESSEKIISAKATAEAMYRWKEENSIRSSDG